MIPCRDDNGQNYLFLNFFAFSNLRVDLLNFVVRRKYAGIRSDFPIVISVNPEVQGQEKAKNIAAATLGEGGQAI